MITFDQRLIRAKQSLVGLSVGDAFGEGFFGRIELVSDRLAHRQPASPPWFWTDDTAMAISIVRILRDQGTIDQDQLAAAFAREYARESNRGYGGTAHKILRAIRAGVAWENASREAFEGIGSYGNGGAMRSAPIGAYFADNPDEAARQAARSAEVTHAHPEGQAGAIAVAVAAAWATSKGAAELDGSGLLNLVLALTPESETRTGIQRAQHIDFAADPQLVATKLGSGHRLSAPDTVPFALWCAARHHSNYAEALWTTAHGLGDVDTTCAIVGGIVVLSSGESNIPHEWLTAREPLPKDL